jgi:hypothetical protein
MPDTLNTADIQEYLDREAIRDVLFRYAHGIDRCDPKILETVYWPEGVDDHGDFKGTRDAFIEWVMPLLKDLMSVTQHQMSNIFIRIEGNLAKVETTSRPITAGVTMRRKTRVTLSWVDDISTKWKSAVRNGAFSSAS